MSNNSINILIVDDEEEICKVLSARFKALNFSPLVAKSGNEAWEIIRSQKIDIVISDVRMSNGTGIELVERIRKSYPKDPKVFLVSGYNSFSREEVFDMGVDGVFEKPFESRTLMNAVRKARMSSLARWQLTNNHEPQTTFIVESSSLDDLEKNGQVKFGSGGFCIYSQDVPNEGERVAFQFNFNSSESIKVLKGVGLVQWVQHEKHCVGLEFEYIESPSIQSFVEWLEKRNLKPFIPKS